MLFNFKKGPAENIKKNSWIIHTHMHTYIHNHTYTCILAEMKKAVETKKDVIEKNLTEIGKNRYGK